MTPHSSELGEAANDVVDDDPGDAVLPVTIDTPNKFCVDYSRRGIAKCKICKKRIQKDELRMGMYTTFKGITITIFHHVACFFKKMQKARILSNVVQGSDEIDGFDEIALADQSVIDKLIEEDKRARTTPLAASYGKSNMPNSVPVYQKKKTSRY